MNTILINLKRLQELDELVRERRRLLDAEQEKFAEAKTKLQKLEAQFNTGQSEFAQLNSRHRELEAEIVDLAAKKVKNEARQGSVSSSNQYEALLKEADFLTTRIGEAEDEILELLDRLEKKEREVGESQALVSQANSGCDILAANVAHMTQESQEELAGFAAMRERLIQEIPSAQLKRYQEIAAVRAGKAVSAAGDGLCLACRLSFPPQLYNDLQRNEKIFNCPNCNRFIYWQEHPDFTLAEEEGQATESPNSQGAPAS